MMELLLQNWNYTHTDLLR